MGFEPTVTVRPHTRSRRAESSALASLPDPAHGLDPGDKGIVTSHPFWSVAVGSCATGTREPGQGRKAAALSGNPGVPQTTWPPLSRAGVTHAWGPIVNKMDLVPDEPTMPSDDDLMESALVEARRASKLGEVPVGAVVVAGGQIVARRHNEREATIDPTAHAEVLALRDAAAKLGSWRLEDATLVVTLEPCPLCAGAAWASRISRVVWGAPNPEAGALGSLYHLGSDPRLNHEFRVTAGIREDECVAVLKEFFDQRRN